MCRRMIVEGITKVERKIFRRRLNNVRLWGCLVDTKDIEGRRDVGEGGDCRIAGPVCSV